MDGLSRATASGAAVAETSTTSRALASTAKVESEDNIGRINLNYKVTDDVLLYAAWSEGFRPGASIAIRSSTTTTRYDNWSWRHNGR